VVRVVLPVAVAVVVPPVVVVLVAMAVAVPPVVVVVATNPAAMRDQRGVVRMAVIPACRKGLSKVATMPNPPRGAE
jgi:hypothetical protein